MATKRKTITLAGPIRALPNADLQQQIRGEVFDDLKAEYGANINDLSSEVFTDAQAKIMDICTAGRLGFEVLSTLNTLIVEPGSLLSGSEVDELLTDEELDVVMKKPKHPECTVGRVGWEHLA